MEFSDFIAVDITREGKESWLSEIVRKLLVDRS